MVARVIFAVLTLATAMLIQPHTVQAAPYWPWCSQYLDRNAAHSCAFISWEQCMATVWGIGGYCYINPYPPPPAFARAEKPSRHLARR